MKRPLRSLTRSLAPAAALMITAACGTGNEPFGALGNNLGNGVQSLPALALPVADNIAIWTSTVSYNTAGVQVDGFEFVLNTISQAVAAPAEGMVIAVATDASSGQSLNSVTILHSARLSTRISKLQTVTVQLGQFVSQGSGIGTSASTLGANFYPRLSVYVDGATVCPYSYFTPAARHSFQTSRSFVSNLHPCIE